MKQKQCTVTYNNEQCLIVRLNLPPTNNLFLFLVHSEPDVTIESLTLPVSLQLDNNKCAFFSKFNDEVLAQLESQGIAVNQGDSLKGKCCDNSGMDEIPVYTIDLSQIEECEELIEIIPKDVLERYQESCMKQITIDTLISVIIQDLAQEMQESGEELDEDYISTLAIELIKSLTVEEINEIFESFKKKGLINNLAEGTAIAADIPQNSKEVQGNHTFDNPAKTWESLADKISKQFS